jgi:tetratricopeptide (TPR) repeat protein
MYIILTFFVLQSELFAPHAVLEFADYLFLEENYDAAVNEYRRYLFLSDSIREDVPERIVECLVRLQQYNEAIKECKMITESTKRDYTKGWIYFLAQDYDSSRQYLGRVGVPYKDNAEKIIGLGYAREFRFKDADKYINLPANTPAYKNPSLGGLFALFPGGGHFYCGRIGDGIFSLLFISTAAILSYYYYDRDEDIKFGFSLGAAILLYAGNIYGGINAVHNYNYYENEKYLDSILSNVANENKLGK